MVILLSITVLSLVVWEMMLLFHHNFWRCDQLLGFEPPHDWKWPVVVAVIPARNEADVIEQALVSLLKQDYPGQLFVMLVDDNSSDGTAEAARAVGDDRLTIISGQPLPTGWVGKMWAVSQGMAVAVEKHPETEYFLFTDADIVHAPSNLRRLMAKAIRSDRVLVSLMVKLRCESFWEKLLIPAFVLFFQKLYPFAAVNDPSNPVAAAAGGCMLVNRRAFEQTGGIESIKDRVIDDCALGSMMKKQGAIWLGLAEDTYSIRPYDSLADIWRMVARSAFIQLRRSWVMLGIAVFGMTFLYLVPVAAAFYGAGWHNSPLLVAGMLGWIIMMIAYAPTLKLYGVSLAWAPLLPLAGLLYTLMTIDSARRHLMGKGGGWKGRHADVGGKKP
jgi:hopene-associated glycosyltransferase HpnB